MKFVLFVEGQTEDKALKEFLERWLNERLTTRVGIKIVRFEGWPAMVHGIDRKAQRYLDDPRSGTDIIAVLALLDLYGPTFYPADKQTASERYQWGKTYLEGQVGRKNFRQHFAVHEVEAWLLSDPSIFPPEVAEALENKYPLPEQVNFNRTPAKLLEELYSTRLKRSYRKPVDGKKLFEKLDPQRAYDKCPSLKALLDDMQALARLARL